MLVAVICTDKPDHIEMRKANRDSHLAYLKSTGIVRQAGPFINSDGIMTGSLIILEVADMQAAKNWSESDPYAKAGLFENVRLEQWNKVI